MIKETVQIARAAKKRYPDKPVILGGWHPSLLPEQTLAAISYGGFYWTHHGVPFAERTTIPADGGFPDNCFDHIFTAGLGKPIAAVKSYPSISDHNPVIVDVAPKRERWR